MNDISAPRSLRWRLALMVVMIIIAAILGLAPNLLPSLSHRHRAALLGAAIGAGIIFIILILVLMVPKARRTYFQLVELREGFCRDNRVMWLSGGALLLYVGTLLLAHDVIPRMTSPSAPLGIGLLPLLAMALYTTATLLQLRKMDELMRKIELESWALSALVVSQGYFAGWVLLKAGLIHLDAGNALLWLGVWLMLVRVVFQVWLVRRYL